MALLYPRKSTVYNNARILPANMYARPATPVFFRGLNGFGYAQSLNTQNFEHTLKQWAVSPFSVNSEAYMERIRKQFGYIDNGTYEAMGTIGGLVGAGVGALIGSGLVQNPIKSGFLQSPLNSINFLKKSSWQLPFKKPEFEKLWTGKIYPKRTKTHDILFGNEPNSINLVKAADNADDLVDTTKVVNTVADTAKVADTVADTTKVADVAKIGSKAGGLAPWAGLTLDTINLGFSVAGLKQSIEAGDAFNILFNSIATVADTASVVGDVLELTPLAPLGFGISVIGGIVSIGVSALQGWLVGSTVGRSLSPEGAKAQGLYLENLYSGMVQRPISTIASALVMTGVPVALGLLGTANKDKPFGNILHKLGIRSSSAWLSDSAFGNQVRAGLSMFTMQAVNSLTDKADKALGFVPEDPNELSFVSAISLIGDINDNFYGATRNKAILLGLTKKDPNAMVNALARAWGSSDDMYYSVTFDDIREAANLDLTPIGNSLFSVLGELLIDPQNYNEVIQTVQENKVNKLGSELINKELDYIVAEVTIRGGEASKGTVEEIFGKQGVLSPSRANKEYRHQAIRNLFKAYIQDGYKGMKKEFARLFSTYGRGLSGDIVGEIGNLGQVKSLSDYFESVLSGGVRKYINLSVEDHAVFKRNLEVFKDIKEKIKENKILTEEEQQYKKQVDLTFRTLEEIYGEEEVLPLINKFLSDFNITADYTKLKQAYTLSREFKIHMDMSDVFAKTLTTLSNPTLTVVKSLSMLFRQSQEFSRRKLFGGKLTARTITTLTEMHKNRNKIINHDKVIEVAKETASKKNYNPMKIRKPFVYNNSSEETIAAETSKAMQEVLEKEKQINEKIDEAEKKIAKAAGEIETRNNKFIYFVPMKYVRHGRSDITINNEEDLVKLESWIKDFETDKISGESLDEARLKRIKTKEELLEYKFRKDAVMFYKANMLYGQEVKDLYKHLETAITLLRTLNNDFQEDTLSLLYLLGTFKTWTSTDGEAFDENKWTQLENYLKENDTNAEGLLLKYGFVPFVTTTINGKREKISGIKAIKIAKLEAAPLELSIKISKETALVKAIQDLLLLSNVDALVHGTTGIIENIKLPDLDQWKSFNDQEKYDFIRKTILATDFSEEAIGRLLNINSLKQLKQTFDVILTDEKDYIEEIIPVESINENTLRRYIAVQQLDKQATNDTLKIVVENLRKIDEDIKTSLNVYSEKGHGSKELEGLKTFMLMILATFNEDLGTNEIFRYLRATTQGTNKSQPDSIGLFITPDGREELLPSFKALKNKSSYTEEELLREFVESPIVKKLATDTREDEYEYMTKVLFDQLDESERLAKQEEFQKTEAEKNKRKDNRSVILKKNNESISEVVPEFNDVQLTDINILTFGTNTYDQIKNKTISKVLIDKHGSLNFGILYEVLKGHSVEIFKDFVLTLTFRPSKFLSSEDKKLYTYYETLKKLGRLSRNHDDLMLNVVKQMLAYVKNSTTLEIDRSVLNYMLDKVNEQETEEALLVRKMLYAYKEKNELKLNVTIRGGETLSKIFKYALEKALIRYISDHKAELNIKEDDWLDDEVINNFKENLLKTKDEVVIGEILKDADIIFNESLERYKLFKEQFAFKSLSDTLLNREQHDIHGSDSRYIGVSGDLTKRLITYDDRVLELYRDAIHFYNQDKDEYETDLFNIISVLKKYIEENYKHKRSLRIDDIESIDTSDVNKVTGAPTITFKLKGIDKTINLFDLVFGYNINLEMVYQIINKVNVNKNLNKDSPEDIQKIQASIQTEYLTLIDTYGGLLNHNVLEIDEDLLLKQGANKEEIAILKDFDVALFYNNLKNNSYLETLIQSVGSDKKNKNQKYKKILYMLGQSIKDIYEQAKIDINDKKINADHKYDVATLFLIKIIESNKLSEDVKKSLIKEIFFSGYHINSVQANQVQIDNVLKAELTKKETALKEAQDKLKISGTEKDKSIVDRILIDVNNLKKEITLRTFEQKNTVNKELEDINKLYEYLISHKEEIPQMFNTKPKQGKTVLARELNNSGEFINDKYYVVEHGAKNLVQVTLGVPPFNIIIGEDIIKENNKAAVDALDKKLNNKDNNKVVYASPHGVVILGTKIDSNLLGSKDEYKKILYGDPYVKADIFFVDAKQLKEIEEMSTSGNYNNTPVYGFIRNPDTKEIYGYVPNILNISAYMNKVPAYLDDLENLPNTDVNTFIERVYKYAEVYSKYAVIRKSYITNVSFDRSETFKNFLKEARINEVYYQFVNLLDPDNSNSFNLENITAQFFKDLYIFKGEDGTFFNLDNLEDTIDIITVQRLKRISIGDTNLFEQLKHTLKELQTMYANSNIRIKDTEVYSKEFVDTLVSMSKLSGTILSELKYKHRKLYDEVIKNYDRKEKRKLIIHATPEESKERVKNGNTFLRAIFKSSSKIAPKLALSNIKSQSFGQQKEIIKRMRDFYNEPASVYGTKNDSVIAVVYKKTRLEAKQRTKDINDSRRKNKRSRLKWETWKQDWDDVRYTVYDYNLSTDASKEKRRPFRIVKGDDTHGVKDLTMGLNIKHKNEKALKAYTKEVFNIYKQAQTVSDPTEQQQYILDVFNNLPYKIETADDMYHLVRNYFLYNYFGNVSDEIFIESQNEALEKAFINAINKGMNKEELSKYITSAVEDWKKRNKNRNFSLESKYRKELIYSDDDDKIISEEDLYEAAFNHFFFVFKNTEHAETIKTILDSYVTDIEEHLFAGKDEPLKVKKLKQETKQYTSDLDFLSEGTEEEQINKQFFYEVYTRDPSKTSIADVAAKFNLKPGNRGQLYIQQDTPVEVPGDFFDILKDIHDLHKGEQFKNASEVYHLLKIPLLDDDPEFKQEFMRSFSVNKSKALDLLELLGIKKQDTLRVYKHLQDAKTMIQFIKYLTTLDFSTEDMFIFVNLVNETKLKYIEDTYKKLYPGKTKWSWAWAHEYFVLRRVKEAIKTVKMLEATETFEDTSRYDNSIIEGVNEHTRIFTSALGSTKETNLRLGAILIPDDRIIENSSNEYEYASLVSYQSRANLEARKLATKITNNLFNKNDIIEYNSISQTREFNRDFNGIVNELMLERSAPSLEYIGSTAKTYRTLRNIFTDVIKMLKPDFKDKDFITIANIGISLNTFIEDPKMVPFFESVLNEYIKTIDPGLLDGVNSAIESIHKVLNEDDYKHLSLAIKDMQMIKAILGYIIQYRFGLVNKQTDFQERIIKYIEEHLEVKQQVDLERIHSLAYQLNPNRTPEELSFIIYDGRSINELTEDEKNELEYIINFQRFIKSSKGLNPEMLDDTLDMAMINTGKLYEEQTFSTAKETRATILLENKKDILNDLIRKRDAIIRKVSSGTTDLELNRRIKDFNLPSGYEDAKNELKIRVSKIAEELDKNPAEEDRINLEDSYKEYNKLLADITVYQSLDTTQKAQKVFNEIKETLTDLKLKRSSLFDQQTELEQARIKEEDELLEALFFTVPAIYRYYMSERATAFEASLNTFTKYKEYLETTYTKHVSDAFIKYMEKELDNKKFFSSIRYMFYKYVKGFKNTTEAFANSKQFLTILNLENEKEFNKIFDEISTEVEKRNKDLKELNKPKTIEVKGKKVYLTQRLREVKEKEYNTYLGLYLTHQENIDKLNFSNTSGLSKKERIKSARSFVKLFIHSNETDVQSSFIETLKALYEKETSGSDLQDFNTVINKNQKFVEEAQDALSMFNFKGTLETFKTSMRAYKGPKEPFLEALLNKVNGALSATELIKQLNTSITYTKDNFKDPLLKTFSNFFEAHKLNESIESVYVTLKSIIDKDDVTLNANLEQVRNTLKGLGKDIEELTNEFDMYENLLSKLPEQIELAEKEISIQEDLVKKLKEESKVINEKLKVDKDYTNKNLGLYRKLYGIDSKTSDEKLIKSLIKEASKIYKGSDSLHSTLQDAINRAGDGDIHNSVVDALITRKVYLKQLETIGKKVPSKFFVFDMETFKDDYHNDSPYQITVLEQNTDEKGKITLNSFTWYINSPMFFSTPGSKYYSQKQGFIEQQRKMLIARNPKITEAEIEQKTNALIDRVKNYENAPEFIKLFIDIFSTEKNIRVPIVAHNGKRFDFSNYDTFLQTYGTRLLRNLYYRALEARDSPDNIRKRIEAQGTNEEQARIEILKAYDDKIEEIFKRFENNNTLNEKEIELLRKLNKARTALYFSEEFAKATAEVNVVINEEAKKALEEKQEHIKNLVFDYITSTDEDTRKQIRAELTAYYLEGSILKADENTNEEKLLAIVSDALDKHEEEYKKMLEDFETIDYQKYGMNFMRQVQEEVLGENADNGIKALVSKQRSAIKQIDNMLLQIEEASLLLVNNRYSVKDAKIILDEKRIAIQEEIIRINDEKNALLAELQTEIVSQEDAVSNMIEFARNIQEQTKNPLYRSAMAYNRFTDAELKFQRSNRQTSASLLKYQIGEEENNARKALDNLVKIYNFINENGYSNEVLLEFLKSERIQLDMFDMIINEETRKKYIEESQERIRSLEKFLEKTDGKYSLGETFKGLAEEYIVKEKVKAKSGLDNLYLNIKNLWNSDEFKKLFENTSLTYKNFEITEDKYKYSSYKEFIEVLKELGKINNNQNSIIFKDLLKMMSSKSLLYKWSYIVNKEDVSKLYEDPEVNKLLSSVIKEDIAILKDRIEVAKKINTTPVTPEDFNKVNLSILTAYFNNYMTKVATKLGIENISKGQSIVSLLMNKEVPVDLDAPLEDAVESYTRRYPKEALGALSNKNIKRVYEHAYQNTDRYGIVVNQDKLVGSLQRDVELDRNQEFVDRDTFRVGFILEDTQDFINLSFAKNNIQGATINFNYSYKTIDARHLPHKSKTIRIELNPERFDNDGHSLGRSILTNEEFLKELKKELKIPGLSNNDLYFKNGINIYEEKAKALYALYFKGVSNYKKYNNIDWAFKTVTKDVVWDHHLHTSVFEKRNITQVIEDDFLDYLDLLMTAGKPISKEEAFKLYEGATKQYLSKVENLEPRNYLTMIPKEFSDFFIVSYDQKDLNRLGIDLLPSSENSMGKTFVQRSFYSFDIPFREVTNPTRSVLSVAKLSSMFTPISVINWGFEQEDNGFASKGFMYGLFNKDDHELNKQVQNKYNIGGTQAKILKDLLVDDYNGELVNIFTPHVLTNSMYERYKRDILHKVGINLKVAFANDPRAFEDGILADLDDAIALGIEKGSKIWLSIGGFKGGITYVKGLRDVYGVTFVANADSLAKRGSGNLELEMAINNIRDYLLRGKDADLRKETIKIIENNLDKIKELFKPTEDGKIIVDAYKQYDVLLNNIEPNLVNKLITTKALNTEHTFEVVKETNANKKVTIKTDKDIKYGKLYIMADPEHTPLDMANFARSETIDKYVFVSETDKASIRDGVVISPSVIYTMEAKGNVEWEKVFPTNNKRVSIYSMLYNFGVEGLLKQYKEKYPGDIDINNLILYLEKELNLVNYIPNIRDYMFYLNRIQGHNEKTTEHVRAFDNYKLNEINLRIKNDALESLTAKQGALYNASFRKHEGIRQQTIPNVNLRKGTVLVSRQGFRELIKIMGEKDDKSAWLTDREISNEEWSIIQEHIKNLSVVETVDYLNSIGIINEFEDNYTLTNAVWSAPENDSDRYLISADSIEFKSTIKEYTGWVLGIRSPVQDYNAVPMLKVVGYNNHHAVEANAYLYKMIGGDNDGDTLGMVAVAKDKKQYLEGIDATKEEYYDKYYEQNKDGSWASYLDVIERDLEMTDPKSHEHRDSRYNYAGKNTFAKGTRNHYSWYELYRLVYGDTGLKNYDTILGNDNTDSIVLTDKEKLFYIDVIRRIHKDAPKNNDDLFKEYNKEILRIAAFDKRIEEEENNKFDPTKLLTLNQIKTYRVTLDESDRALLKDVSDEDILTKVGYQEIRNKIAFNLFYSQMLQQTSQRIQVSKRGINAFGNIRKQILLRSRITTEFPEAMKDARGDSFGDFKDNLSAAGFLKTLKIKMNKDIEHIDNKEELKKYINKHGDKAAIKSVSDSVYNEIISYLFKNIKEAIVAKRVSGTMQMLISTKSTKFLTQLFIDNPNMLSIPLMADLKDKYLQEGTISDTDLELVKSVVFGRLAKEITKKVFDNAFNIYLQQPIIGRVDFNNMSRDATKIIAVAKHAGLDIDAADYLDEYMRDLKKQLKSIQGGRYISVSVADLRMALAMTTDADYFRNNNININKSDELRTVKGDLDKAVKPATNYKRRYSSVADAENNVNAIINETFNSEFFGYYAVPDEVREPLKQAVLKLFEIFKANKNILDALKLAETTKVSKEDTRTISQILIEYGVAGYKLQRFLIKSYSIYKNAENILTKNIKNKRLSVDHIELIKDSSRFINIIHALKIKEEKSVLEKIGRRVAPTIVKILLNEQTVDQEFLKEDEDGNLIRAYNEHSVLDSLEYDRTDLKIQLGILKDNVPNAPRIYKSLDDFEKKQLELLFQDFDFLTLHARNDGTKMIQQLQDEFKLASLTHQKKTKQAIEEASVKDIEDLENNPLLNTSKYVYDSIMIKPDLIGIKEAYEKYKEVIDKINKLQEKINILSSMIVSKTKTDIELEEVINNYNRIGDMNVLKNDLESKKVELENRKKEIHKQFSDIVYGVHFKKFSPLMHTSEGLFKSNLYKKTEDNILKEEDVSAIKNSQLLTFANMQVPFLSMLEIFLDGNDFFDIPDSVWKDFFEYYKENQRFSRLTVLMDAFEDETLIKNVLDHARKQVKSWEGKEKLSKKEFAQFLKETSFLKPEDLQEYMKRVQNGEDLPEIKFNGKTIKSIDEGIKLGEAITPTLKEIFIENWRDLKAVFEFMKENEELQIGFVSLDNLMTAMPIAYKPYRLTGRLQNVIKSLGHYEKLFMRYSTGFLWRNAVDSWFQLMTEYYQRNGLAGVLTDTPQIIKYMGMSWDVFNLYNEINGDRLTNLVDLDKKYQYILRTLKKDVFTSTDLDNMKQAVKEIKDYLKVYVDIAKAPGDSVKRMNLRLPLAEKIFGTLENLSDYVNTIELKTINNLKVLNTPTNLRTLKASVTFLLNTRFAEYYTMHEKLYSNLGSFNKEHVQHIRKINHKYQRKSKESLKDLKSVLFEISAFMNTNAFIDEFQKDIYKELKTIVNEEKMKDESNVSLSYEDAIKDVENHFKYSIKDIFELITLKKPYDYINGLIENVARISGFLIDRYMNDDSFDRATHNSLRRFFNYGMRGPFELKSMADVPYLSFPVRSIDNWINRLSDPRFIVLMDDLIDGLYGQYQDEDGQYGAFTQFQISNGWLPITKTFGIRLGNGALDIQKLLSDPSSLYLERGRPLLRAVKSLVVDEDFTQAIKNLAAVGPLSRTANFFTALTGTRNVAQKIPGLNTIVSNKPASIGTTSNMFFDQYNYDSSYKKGYSKYTPYKYRNANNGRYARYENIYKNWFNKYGKMRKPLINPYSLVKDIQWQQYVRWRQSQRL